MGGVHYSDVGACVRVPLGARTRALPQECMRRMVVQPSILEHLNGCLYTCMRLRLHACGLQDVQHTCSQAVKHACSHACNATATRMRLLERTVLPVALLQRVGSWVAVLLIQALHLTGWEDKGQVRCMCALKAKNSHCMQRWLGNKPQVRPARGCARGAAAGAGAVASARAGGRLLHAAAAPGCCAGLRARAAARKSSGTAARCAPLPRPVAAQIAPPATHALERDVL